MKAKWVGCNYAVKLHITRQEKQDEFHRDISRRKRLVVYLSAKLRAEPSRLCWKRRTIIHYLRGHKKSVICAYYLVI